MTRLGCAVADEDYTDQSEPGHDAEFNSADRGHIKARERAQRLAEKSRDEVLHILLAEPNGRAFLSWLIYEECDVFGRTTVLGATDHPLVWANAIRSIGLRLHDHSLRVNPQGYTMLLGETFGADR